MATSLVSPSFSFTFIALQQNLFTWNLTDNLGNIITGATVTSTLYSGRSITNPTAFPGTPDIIFQNISMPEVGPPSGIYQAIIPASFNPSQSADGFVVVVSANSGSTLLGIWSTVAVVVPAANTLDLVTLDAVKQWLNMPEDNTDDDGLLQICISGFSQYVLNRTGVSSFNLIQTYTEVYDGNNNNRLFLRNYPITAVSNVQIGTYNVPLSTGITSPGLFIDQIGRSIAFRSGASILAPFSLYPYCFVGGTGNIQVTYQAGYANVPFDLAEAVIKAVAINYRRKDWIDLDSKALTASGGGTGNTRYRAWALPPEIERVLWFYQRYGK